MVDQKLLLTIKLDSGADESFIDQEEVLQLDIETELLDFPIEAKDLNAKLLARFERRSVPVKPVFMEFICSFSGVPICSCH